MPDIAFGLLAHSEPKCVADLIDSVHHYAPDSSILLFNGGLDDALGKHLGIETCRYSRPVRWGKGLQHFLLGVMRQLREDQWEYDYLVTLDSDMLLIQKGLASRLVELMRDADYMAAFYRAYPKGDDWLWGQRMYLQWRQWGPLLGPPPVRACYNPGQVLSHEYVEALFAWSRFSTLQRELERSKLQVLEELVWPSLVDALGLRAKPWPDLEASALHGFHPPTRVAQLQANGVHLLHKVKMDISAPERIFARSLRIGSPIDVDALTARCGQEYENRDPPTVWPPPDTLRTRAVSTLLAAQSLWWAGTPQRKAKDEPMRQT